MAWESIQGFFRHALTFGGGFLVTNGTFTESEMTTAVGAIVTLVGLGWSIWQKRQAAE